MKMPRHPRAYLLVGIMVIAVMSLQSFVQKGAETPATPQSSGERDGQHDFDSAIGTWKTQLSLLLHPLTGSTTWIKYAGTTVVRKAWNGRANMVEVELDGPRGHLEFASIRLYDPQSHKWNISAADGSNGLLSETTSGEFKGGQGEFYNHATFDGKDVYVRFIITEVNRNTFHSEQSFSIDGGKTWEKNWVSTDTRVGSADPGGAI